MTEEIPDTQPEDITAVKTSPLEEPVAVLGRLEQDNRRVIYLASWSTRFWAWLVDFILIILFLNIVRGILSGVSLSIPAYWDLQHWEPVEFGFQTLFFFLYWTIMEGFRGQSIGKMVLNLKVVNRDGSKVKYGTAAIESVGKAFLLPLDCLIGWLAMPNSKLRVFNRISNTIVIKTDYKEPAGIVYIKEKE